MRDRRRQAGFTLIELLVALALLGMLGTLLYSGIRDGARAWGKIENRSAEVERVLLAQSFLRDRIAGLGPPPAPPNDPEAGLGWFSGADDRLAWTAPWLERLPVAGLYRMEVGAGTGPDGTGVLALRWRPDGRADADEPADEARTTGERVLLDGVAELRFSYFGAEDEGGAKAWHPAWRSGSRVPDLVRIDLEFHDPGRTWPALIIAIP